jgi:4'-phosphopantetheinyl transferase EntD
MPLEKIVVESSRAWALWLITEDEISLSRELNGIENVPESLKNSQKRLEWLAGRVATREVMQSLNIAFHGIAKDEFGKPFPKMSDLHLSLSHSFPYAAALLDKNSPVGIDLEQPKEKLLRIARRIHHADELHDLGTDLVKHCIYWCAKESMIKMHGRKDLIFAENMFIQPFQREEEGNITGKFIIDNNESIVRMYYVVYPGFIMVYTC